MSLQREKTDKQSLSGSAATLFFARLFPALALFLCWIGASHIFDMASYAYYQRFWIQLSTFAAIAAVGYPTFIFNHPGPAALALLKSVPANKKVFYTGIVVAMAALFGYLQSSAGIAVWAALSFLAWTASMMLEATLLSVQRKRAVILLNTAYAIAMTLTHALLLHQGAGLQQIILSICIILSAKAVISFLLLQPHQQTASAIQPTLSYGEIAQQWRHFAVNDTVQMLFRWVDKFILSFLLSQSAFAIYVNSSIDIPFLPILFTAVSGAAVQHWALQATKGEENPLPMLHHSVRLLAALVLPLFAFLVIFRIEFLTIVFSARYASGVTIFVCAQLVLPLRAYPFTGLLQRYKRADIITRGALIDFGMACMLMYPLYRLFDLPGIALAFVVSTYWQAGYYLIKTQKVTGFSLASLFPARLLLSRLSLAMCLFFGAYQLTTALSWSSPTRFVAGLIILTIYALSSLAYEWRKD